jgi:hypothetical protein
MPDAPSLDWALNEGPKALQNAVEDGNELKILLELRRLVAHELEGNRCAKCRMSNMNTGQIASLVAKLVDLNERIDGIKAQDDTEDPLSIIQNRPRLASVTEIHAS